MSNPRLRRQIAHEAARLIFVRRESEYGRAKLAAARRICRGWVRPQNLPTDREVRDEIERITFGHETASPPRQLQELRREALQVMRWLEPFKPRLCGPAVSGTISSPSAIRIKAFSDHPASVSAILELQKMPHEIEQKTLRSGERQQVVTRIHFRQRFQVAVTVFPWHMSQRVFRSSQTGRPIEHLTLADLEQAAQPVAPRAELGAGVDRFQVYLGLLLPLEQVQQPRRWHPEGDALYHSLQVFELARNQIPYDEEFLLAALLHDVGKAIDPQDHVAAGLEVLAGIVTDRTLWFIEHLSEAMLLREGRIGARCLRRLEQSPDFEQLKVLADCDRRGRQPGAPAPEADQAIEYLRELVRSCGE
jgi:hypothetical protein